MLAAAAAAAWPSPSPGGGSKLGLGNPPERADLLVDTERLDQVLEHAAGDLVVGPRPGCGWPTSRRRWPRPASGWPSTRPSPGPPSAGWSRPTPRAAAAALRHRPRPDHRHHRGPGRRHRRPGRRQGGQERRRLRPGQAVLRVATAPSAWSPRSSSGCTRCRRPRPWSRVAVDGARRGRPGRCWRLLRSALEPSAIELDLDEWGWPGRLTVVFEGIQPGWTPRRRPPRPARPGRRGGRGRAGRDHAALSQPARCRSRRRSWRSRSPARRPSCRRSWPSCGRRGRRPRACSAPCGPAATGVLHAGCRRLREGDLRGPAARRSRASPS